MINSQIEIIKDDAINIIQRTHGGGSKVIVSSGSIASKSMAIKQPLSSVDTHVLSNAWEWSL